uniref:energy transducer TonB n=1 Tax=Candidatus Cryptobacteroides bacterium TaxID=3085639 RepID=UPI00402574B5
MKRIIRILIVVLAVVCWDADCWLAKAQEARKAQTVNEQDMQLRCDVTDYLFDWFTKQMKSFMRMPSGDMVFNDISINSESMVIDNKVLYDTAYRAIDTEETKSNIFYYFLRYSDQCTPMTLLCIDSGRNIIYRFRNKAKDEYKDVNISVEELKELLGISEVTMSLRRTAFSKSLKIMDSPFEIFSDHCALTTNMDMKYSEVPDDIMISDEDFQSMLLKEITSNMDNSIIPIIALYLELDLEEIFKDIEGKSKSFYVTYSQLVRLFHKSTEKVDITKVSSPFPPELKDIDLSNLGDYDGEYPIPFQLVDTKPQFEGGGVENFQKWISERIIYSPIAKAKGISGRVTLSVIIDKKGNVGNVKVLRGVIPVLDEEAVRVVKTSPKWTPGYLNGKAVNVNYTIPVTYTL